MKRLTNLSFAPQMVPPRPWNGANHTPQGLTLLLKSLQDESALPRLRCLDFGMSLKDGSNVGWSRFPRALEQVLAGRMLVDATLEEWTAERIKTLGTSRPRVRR